MKKSYTFWICLFLSFPVLSQSFNGNQADIDKILENTTKFSAYVVAGDFDKIAASYTQDAKIFPDRSKILEGSDIKGYWTRPEGYTTKYHKITQSEVTVIEDTAYDYGYYQGISQNPKGEESKWAGKYVIIWKKEKGDWKMYLDIWNSSQLSE